MSKELDEETGLYYYGARYLDPKYSRWLSGDPALNDYIPKAPIDDDAKKHNENLPGMGGVFNVVNLHLYHYAGNNPVKYVDPDGRQQAIAITPSDLQMFVESVKQTFSSVPTPLVVVGAVATGVIIADDYFDGAISEGIANGINFIADKTIEAGKWIGEKIAGLFSKGDNESKTSATAPSIKSPVTSGSPLPMNDPDDDRDKSNKNPFRGERDEPKTIYDKNGRPKQTRTYKEDGYPDVDIDYDHNHGQGQPHQHKWTRPENGPPTYKDRQPGIPLDPN